MLRPSFALLAAAYQATVPGGLPYRVAMREAKAEYDAWARAQALALVSGALRDASGRSFVRADGTPRSVRRLPVTHGAGATTPMRRAA